MSLRIIVAMVLLFAGCSKQDAPQNTPSSQKISASTQTDSGKGNGGNSNTVTGKPGEWHPGRPDTKSGTIATANGSITVAMTLMYKDIPYSLYIPEDMVAERDTASPKGTRLRIYNAPKGKVNRGSWAEIYVPNEATTLMDLTGALLGSDGLAEQYKFKVTAPPQPFPHCVWGAETYAFAGKETEGYACLSVHATTKAFYVVVVQKKGEKNFPLRVDAILGEFQWNDDGRGLGG
ncbi:MAG: hypothetical protein IT211_10075 [Armatimonadetes bacterium]|nr:hypothetical protein [Armatimonadota bacterium]